MMNNIYEKVFAVVSLFSSMSVGAANHVITDYGVKEDSTILQTKAIQNVIDSVEALGGGRIVVPRGTYLTGALFFKPGTSLELQEGAVLKGSDNIDDYPLLPSRMEGKNIYYYAALINAYHVKGFSIEGPGTVNGNGLNFWKGFWARRSAAMKAKKPWTNLEVHRPRLVFVWGCDSITFKGAKFINSGYWTTHFYQCNDILIENCEMRAPRKPVRAPSTDAVDLDVCKNVVIRGCYISCDDDGVCIKGGKGPLAHKANENGIVENVLVENCTFGPSLHGVLTMGSEAIHAKNVTLRNCKLNTSCALLRLKMRPDTYQIYEDITIENVTGTCGSVIDMKYWSQFFSLEGTNEHPYGIVRNVKFSNVDVDCDNFIYMKGNKNDKVSKVTLENVTARTHKTDKIVNAYKSATKMKNVVVNGKSIK